MVKTLPAMQETRVQSLGWEDPLEKGMATHSSILGLPGGSHDNQPAMQETWVQSLGWEDPLEKEMATNFSILAWKNPMDRGAYLHRHIQNVYPKH